MARKQRIEHTCTTCGYSTPKWLGRCPDCGDWGTMQERTVGATSAKAAASGGLSTGIAGIVPASPAVSIAQVNPDIATARPTGIGELDRVLGRGIVPGSVILFAGEPGVGKSTLLLSVAHVWAERGQPVLYVTAEESAGQVRLRAERTQCLSPNLYLASESNLDVVVGHVEQLNPSLLIVDSVQTMQTPGVEGVAGGVSQTRATTAALTALAKSRNLPIVLVGHVTKDGNVAGPRTLEHLVDVVVNFEGERHSSLRILRGLKNRFGTTDEVGCFEQQARGIVEVKDPSGLFLSHHESTPDGSAITVAMDGLRPLMAEVQALVVETPAKNPRRAVTGLDSTRVPMVLAVLTARAGLNTSDKEVYVATVGGMKVSEPATDLAVALATVSAMRSVALPPRTIVIGEVGLAGEVRAVPNVERRLAEAHRLGFNRAIVPVHGHVTCPGMDIKRCATLSDAIAAAFGKGRA